jgi:LuxR family maltose regulon positive regulatory protein
MNPSATGDLILRTKIQIPRLRPHRVERERLVQRLRESAWSRLTLVSAPAGFGKTTMLAAWAHAAGHPVAWLALEEADNALERFLRYLASALDRAVSGVGAASLAMLATPQPLQAEAFISNLINDLSECDGPLTLVIDDYHLIEARPIHAALDFLLEHLPDCLRLVIAGRADPPLALARLRARGELVELRGADLRFTTQETADFLNQVMGLKLGPAEIEAIEARTEGWIAGLQLAALSLQDRPDTERFLRVFTGSHRYVLDYLVEEVLRRQPEEIQQFLLKTSILERLSPDLCEALLGDRGALFTTHVEARVSILDYLDRANLFIQPLDEERSWFRYHMLFADLLRFRLEQNQTELLPELHHRAAVWFEHNQMAPEAVHHYLAAGELRQAAIVVEKAGEILLSQGQVIRFLSWMDSLPPTIFETHPRLHLMAAWGLISTTQIQLIDSHLDQAEQGLGKLQPGTPLPGRNPHPEALLEEITSTRAILATLKSDYPAAIRLSEQALAAEHAHGDDNLRSSILIGLGVAYRATGQAARAEQTMAEAAQAALAGRNYAVGLSALSNQGDSWLEMGDLAKAEACYRRVLAIQSETGMIPVSSLAYGGLAELAYERGDFDQALSLVRSAIEMDEQWGSPDIGAINQVRLARILLACGESESGWEALARAEEIAQKQSLNMFDHEILQTLKVSMWLAYGKRELARDWLHLNPPTLPPQINYFDEPHLLACAEVMVGQGIADHEPEMLEQAVHLLDALLATMQSRDQMGWMLPGLVRLACANYALHREDQALAALEKALSIAAPQDYRQTFTRAGTEIAALLRLARQTTPYPDYVDRLLAGFSEPAPGGPSRAPALGGRENADLLSPREIEVLGLVVQGLSNQEIAARLVLASGTVKRHLHNIFEKLHVTTRPQAIAKARQLHLG